MKVENYAYKRYLIREAVYKQIMRVATRYREGEIHGRDAACQIGPLLEAASDLIDAQNFGEKTK